MQKIDNSLGAMDRALAERTHCMGIHLSLADIAVGAALGYLDFRFPAIDWRGQHPSLGALYERLAQRPSFKDTLPT
jgi:glutathione S-transferase